MCDYASRQEAARDPVGKKVTAKRVRINAGAKERPEMCCRLVAREPGYGERLGDLFAETPCLAVAKLCCPMLPTGASWRCFLHGRRALYGAMRRHVYIELPQQCPKSWKPEFDWQVEDGDAWGDGCPSGMGEMPKEQMLKMSCCASALHPPVY